LVFAAASLWGTSATLARFLFSDRQVPPLTVVELRLLVAIALLGPWLVFRRPRALRVDRADWGYFLVLGLFGVAAIQSTYYYAIARLGVGLAILLQYLAPSIIVLHDWARGRSPSARTLAAVAAAVAGTALLVGGVGARPVQAQPFDWMVGLASAFAFAFYIAYSKRGLVRYPPETVLLYTFIVAAVLWAIVTPPWRIVAAGYGARLWGMFLALGVCSTLVPFTLFYAGLRHLPAAQASIVATLEPVVAVLSAAVFLGEGLSPFQWAGAALVLIASVFAGGPEGALAAERA
jgi:drug/metabolite transporter (DMT)-like permease